MSVVKVDSSTNGNNTSVKKNNNIIGELQKVKAKLQEQIQKTNESKMDDKLKKERIDELKQQIQQIDMQIQEIQAERLNKNQKKLEEGSKNNNKNVQGRDSVSLTAIADLANISTTYSTAKILNKTKKGLDSRIKILKTEIKLDAGRGFDNGAKQAELSKAQFQSKALSRKLGEVIEKVQNDLKEVTENASKHSSSEDNNDENSKLIKQKNIDVVV